MKKIFNLYSSILKTHPKATNALTTGILFGIGDIVAQLQFPDDPGAPYDPFRTLQPFVYGTFIFSFIGNSWYQFLNNKIVFPNLKPNHWANTVARVSCDQIFFAPVGITLYFTTMTVFKGGTTDEILEKLTKKWWPTLVANWSIWPIFQFINFSIIPVQHRLLTVNLIAIFWNTFLSSTNSEKV